MVKSQLRQSACMCQSQKTGTAVVPLFNLNRQDHLDQYQYLGNCPPTPPLTQEQSIDDKLRLMLSQGRGRWAVAQILILIQSFFKSLLSVSVPEGLHIEDVNFLLITCSFKLTCEAGYKYENKSSEFICQHKAV